MQSVSPQNVTFASNGGQAHGYLVLPPSGSGPAVVVIQEWWGLTSHIADVTRRLAGEGFVALAPDLYGGATAHDPSAARRLKSALPEARAARDLGGTIDYLLELDAVTSGTVGAIGFCMGGGFVLSLAAQQGDRVSAAVPFYGLPDQPPDYSGLTAAIQGHYGMRDRRVRPGLVDQAVAQIHRQSAAHVRIFSYAAGHAFFNDEGPHRNFDPKAAALAWDRAVTFLRERVR